MGTRNQDPVALSVSDLDTSVLLSLLVLADPNSVQHTCQPIQITCIKKFLNHYFGGIWPHWKMDTGKHNFHEILLLFFKLSKKIEKLSNEQPTHTIAKCTLIGLVQ